MRTILIGVVLLIIILTTVSQFAAALPWLQVYDSAVWSQQAGLEPPETAWIVECRTEWINRTR